MSTLVIIPTYNERENVASIVGRVRASPPDVFVLVVDDSSPDGTGRSTSTSTGLKPYTAARQ